MPNNVERKLTAILYADVAGYSRLTGLDEEGTHLALSNALDSITTSIESQNGVVLHYAGDAMLAEFASVVNALTCAVTIQRDLMDRNKEVPEERKLEFRIGINLGDVIVDRQEIYGDGVNVAARLECLAEPSGICISRSVLEQVKNKMELGYEYLGHQKVKNIAEPIHAYKVILEPKIARAVAGERKMRLNRTQWMALGISLFLLLAVSTIILRSDYFRPARQVSEGKIETPAIPSIAVLPFKNLSDNPEQDYFSDGITEDIITDLSKFRDLFVIASNTAFTYKDKPVKVEEVSQELGVQYILEGSVQRSDEQVRINAQLIDGTTGHHHWAERFVRDFDDLFLLQDEIVQTIVGTLAIEVGVAERNRAMRTSTENLKAYDYVLRGRELRSRVTSSANTEARSMFRRAIDLDPLYSSAYVDLGWCYFDSIRYGWTASPSEALQNAHDLAQQALGIEESDASAHRLLGSVHLKWTQYDLAESEFERAIKINPNDAASHDALGSVWLYTGQVQAAIGAVETALRFNPNLHVSGLVHLALAYYLDGQYDGAIRIMEKSLGKYPEIIIHHIILAAAHAQANHPEEATRAAEEVRRRHPFFEVGSFGSAFRDETDRKKLAEGLRKAGLE
jgi:adenylate cyclase